MIVHGSTVATNALLEGKGVTKEVSDRLIHIYTVTQHKRLPIPTIYD